MEALERLGVAQILVNEEGKRTVDKTTVFFMPHCPMQLYNNVIWANWSLNLSNVIVVGNSFTLYDDVMNEDVQSRLLPCVMAARHWVVETKLRLPKPLFLSFNNTRYASFDGFLLLLTLHYPVLCTMGCFYATASTAFQLIL